MLPYTSELAELKTIPEYILFFKAKTKSMGCTKSGSKRENYSATGLLYSTGNHIHYFLTAYIGKESDKSYI